MRSSDWSSTCALPISAESHDDEDLAVADLQVGRAHGADQTGALDLRQARRARPPLQEALGALAEQLPDVAAGKFHRSLQHHTLRIAHLLATESHTSPGTARNAISPLSSDRKSTRLNSSH